MTNRNIVGVFEWRRVVLIYTERRFFEIYLRFSPNHLDRYVKEYADRRKLSFLGTIEQMSQQEVFWMAPLGVWQ